MGRTLNIKMNKRKKETKLVYYDYQEKSDKHVLLIGKTHV